MREAFSHSFSKSLKTTSIWWIDLSFVGSKLTNYLDWFGNNIQCKLGRGDKMLFWCNKWCREHPLCLRFPKVFSALSNSFASVSKVGCWVNNVWKWNRSLFTFAGQQYTSQFLGFRQELSTYSPDRHGEDSFVWSDNLSGLFSVKSCYMGMLKSQLVSGDEILLQLKRLWKTKVLSKIQIFGWRLLINRHPSKIKLDKRGIFHSFIDLMCVYCFTLQEDLYHLLISYPFA